MLIGYEKLHLLKIELILKINQLCFIDYLHALNLMSLVRAGSCALLVRAGWCPGWKSLPACLEPCILGWCGYLHALNLVSLVGVSWLVRVLVGSRYLHALNLVSLVRVVGVLGWCPGWKWLPTYLEPRVLGWCVLVGSCPWLVWLPACLEPCILGWCVLGWCGYLHALNLVSLVGVSLVRAGWCALLVGVLVGSGYLHALNLVSLVRALLVCLGWCGYLHALNLVSLVRVSWLVWLPACLEPRVPGSCGWCPWLEVVTCMP